MNPLIDNFTKNLSPCRGCEKSDLSDPIYDYLWKPKEKNQDAVHNQQANSGGGRDATGSGGED